MGKYRKEPDGKKARNFAYASLYRQLRCRYCGHLTSRPGTCKECKNIIRRSDVARQIRGIG